ncbi:MAG TPA: hypothetical protein VLV83_07965 [Acidobacteriota bacterium]|nr:hypothetical protein [Acidobacteriota bacterium]
MPTVKEGQTWASDFARRTAADMGFDIRTFWRAPANGLDWTLEMTVEESGESVEISVWFYDLKRLDKKAKAGIQEKIHQGLKDLHAKIAA